jgi:hypothetical protein
MATVRRLYPFAVAVVIAPVPPSFTSFMNEGMHCSLVSVTIYSSAMAASTSQRSGTLIVDDASPGV